MSEKKGASPRGSGNARRPRDPDDAPELNDEWFDKAELRVGSALVRRGRPKSAVPKSLVSLRLDAEVLAYFRATGAGWQTRINNELRQIAGARGTKQRAAPLAGGIARKIKTREIAVPRKAARKAGR